MHQILLAFLILCLPASAGYAPTAPTLQPYQVVSPEGTWRLEVKPGNRIGSGPAATTLTNVKSGEIAWKRMLPYTFWQCCVNEEGGVGGFAYTEGPLGHGDPDKDAGDFVVSFLDARGEPMHEERSHRSPSYIGMGYYIPAHCAVRVLHDPGNERMVLLMANGQFRCHSMRDGTLQSAFIPESEGEASAYGWPDEIRFIPNTRLMLLQSNSAWGSSDETTCKACIQIIDEGGRTVWATSFHKIYGKDKEWPFPKFQILTVNHPAEADPIAGEDLPDEDPFAENPAPAEDPSEFDADPPAPTEVASFEIHFGDTGEKVKFRILNASGNDEPPAYQVVEVSREKWEFTEKRLFEDDDKPPADFPIASKKQPKGFQLKDAGGKPLSGISAVAVGPEETIHAMVTQDSKIHVFDRHGRHLRTLAPGKEYSIDSYLTVDEKGEVFVRIPDNQGNKEGKTDPLGGHYLCFSPDGTLKEKPISPQLVELPSDISIHSWSDNLFFHSLGNEVTVTQRGQYGSRVADLSHRADGQWLEYVQDVAIAPDGTIAVRDTSKEDGFAGFAVNFPRLPNHLPAETITIYEADGKPIRTLDFTAFAALTEIVFDGKHIIATFDFNSPPTHVYVFDAEAKPVGAIQIGELAEREIVNLSAFIVSGGSEILAVDKYSGMTFRLAMP